MVADRTRVLVVGCGSIGQRHARLLAERADVEVTVCDSLAANRQAAVAATGGAVAFDSYEAALAAGPEAIFVCTPNHLHRPMAVAALEAGCDVMCEKPLADTVDNALAIAAAAAATQRMLWVGYSVRCHPAMRRLQALTAEGFCGQLVGGRAMVGTYYTLMCAKTPYRFQEENALISDYTHLNDYLRWVFGDLQQVSAAAATLGDLEMMPRPNMVSMLLRYASGALVQVHEDYIQHPQRHILEVFGDERTLVMDFMKGQLEVFDRRQDGYHTELFMVGRDDIYRTQIEGFLAAQRGDRQPLVSAADGVAALQAAAAVIEAARENRVVRL